MELSTGANHDLFTSNDNHCCSFCARSFHRTMSERGGLKLKVNKSLSLTPEEDFIGEWLDCHPEYAANFVKRWLSSHPQAAHDVIQSYFPETPSSIPPLKNPPKYKKKLRHHMTSPSLNVLPQNVKKNVDELRKLDKNSLLYELLSDVVSPNLNVNQLTHKILVNILVLTNADRSSLFMVEGPVDSQILVSRLFDVTVKTSLENAIHEECDAIRMPVGVGIAGTVAKTGETINLKNAYDDPRFNRKVDIETGYQTKSILCMPIKTANGQVIGVAQVINKDHGENIFTSEDEDYFTVYLKFCAIGLANSRLLDQSFSLSKRLQILLHLARELFEDTTKLEVVMTKVMQESMQLIPCQHCSVLLLDKHRTKEEVSFSYAFQMTHSERRDSSEEEQPATVKSLDSSEITDMRVVEYVARTANPVVKSHLCPGNVNPLSRQLSLDKETKSILCVPIANKDDKVLGIVKLTNKLRQASFSQGDLESLEVFATFCGLGLHNVMMYEEIAIANARNKVAFDVLAYHASSNMEEVNRLMRFPIPNTMSCALSSFKFDDLPLSEDETILGSVRIFIDTGLVEAFKIDIKVLYRWVLSVKKNYRPVTYHNWRHAFNVAQTMFAMLNDAEVESKLSKVEQLALIIACFCHDLDHRGTNNAFQVKSGSVLAELYSTSTMEHHHFDHCIMILNSEGNELLHGLSPAKYTEVLNLLESAILSTDLALYFKKKDKFQNIVKTKEFNWEDHTDKDLLRGMLMTACDVAAITKPWKTQKRVANMVAGEFFEQGDLERNNFKEEPVAMMDRKKKDELPKMQVGFIDFVCMPLYKILAELLPPLTCMHDGVTDNRKNWQTLADDPKAVVEEEEEEEEELPAASNGLGPRMAGVRLTRSNNDIISTIESEMAEYSDSDAPSPLRNIPTVDITPTVSSMTGTTMNNQVPEPQGSNHLQHGALPMVAWKSDSALEVGSKKKKKEPKQLSRSSKVAEADTTRAEVVMRRRRLPCAMS